VIDSLTVMVSAFRGGGEPCVRARIAGVDSLVAAPRSGAGPVVPILRTSRRLANGAIEVTAVTRSAMRGSAAAVITSPAPVEAPTRATCGPDALATATRASTVPGVTSPQRTHGSSGAMAT